MPPLNKQEFKQRLLDYRSRSEQESESKREIEKVLNKLTTSHYHKKLTGFTGFVRSHIPPEQQKDLVVAVWGEKGYEDLLKRRKSVLAGPIRTILAPKFPDVFFGKHEYDELVAFAEEHNVQEVIDKINEPNLLLYLTESTCIEKLDPLFDYVAEHVSAEQLQEISDSVEAIKGDYFLTDDEIERPTHTEQIDGIRRTLTGTEEEKKRQNELLDYANRNLFSVKADYSSTFSVNLSSAVDHKDREEIENAVQTFGIEKSLRFEPTAAIQPNADPEHIRALRDLPTVTLSKQMEEGLSLLFGKFEEMEKNCTNPVDFKGEQGDKIYGFFEYQDAYVNLDRAVKKQDLGALEKAVEQHQNAMKNIAEMETIAKEHFHQDYGYGGNLDVSRCDHFPNHLIRDPQFSSQVNGAFQVYSLLRNNNVSKEEFFKDPYGTLARLKEKSLIGEDVRVPNEQVTRPDGSKMPLGEAILTLTDTEFSVSSQEAYALRDRMGAFLRSSDFLTYAEPDPEHRAASLLRNARAQASQECVFSYVAMAKAYFPPITGYNASPEEETYANLFLFGDEERDYQKLNVVTVRDPKTMEVIAGGFRRDEYLLTHDVDPSQIMNRIMTTFALYEERHKDFKHLPKKGFNDLSAGAIRLASELVKSHPDRLNEPGYKELNKFVRDPQTTYDKWKVAYKKQVDKEIENDVKALKNEEKAFARALKAARKTRDEATRTQKTEQLKEERINALKERFRNGRIPERYFTERVRQIRFDLPGDPPPFFECDAFPNQKTYLNNNRLEGLTKEEAKGIYDSAKERARFDKKNFLKVRRDLVTNFRAVEKPDPDAALEKAGSLACASEAEWKEEQLFAAENIKNLDPIVPEREPLVSTEEGVRLVKDTDLDKNGPASEVGMGEKDAERVEEKQI